MDELIRTTCPRDCYDACGDRGGQARRAASATCGATAAHPGQPWSSVSSSAPPRTTACCVDARARLTDAAAADRTEGQPAHFVAGRAGSQAMRGDRASACRRSSPAPEPRRSLTPTTPGTFALLGLLLRAALLQPPRRDRGRSRHDLQQGRATLHSTTCIGTSARRLRPAHGARRGVRSSSGEPNPSASAPHQHEHWLGGGSPAP